MNYIIQYLCITIPEQELYLLHLQYYLDPPGLDLSKQDWSKRFQIQRSVQEKKTAQSCGKSPNCVGVTSFLRKSGSTIS